jgi:diketogulonate reductase-like aldo/keto reductase
MLHPAPTPHRPHAPSVSRASPVSPTRRAVLRAGGGLLMAGTPRQSAVPEPPTSMSTSLIHRIVPRTGESLPAIGLGTWQTFDVGDGIEREPLRHVLQAFLARGGRVIDSSPMYGRAEAVVGRLLAERPAGGPRPFLATKVWTRGRAEGEAEMRRSTTLMGSERLDLLQVHNLLDWKTHLQTLRTWKMQGRVRYIGVTHYQLGAFAELERIVAKEGIDFVQLPYSIATRDAETRLLPAAAAAGVAVIVMRPFEEGALFARVKGRNLPPWAADFDCATWAQFFLKFILSHAAVTCPIPATANPKHIADNLAAAQGRLPDATTRKKMIAYLGI